MLCYSALERTSLRTHDFRTGAGRGPRGRKQTTTNSNDADAEQQQRNGIQSK